MKSFNFKLTISGILLVALVATVLLLPRASLLNSYTYVGETFYLKHSAQFYWAIANKQYQDTYRIVHPGVTVMWLGAGAFWQYLPEYEEWESVEVGDLQLRRFIEKNDLSLLLMQVFARRAIVFFNTILLVVAFVLCWRLFGKWLAVGIVLLVGFDPYYFDFSRYLYPDGVFSTLILVALLLFILYLREGKWSWLVLTGAAVGLAVLSKIIGLIVLGIFGMLALWEWWQPSYDLFTPSRSLSGFRKFISAMFVLVTVILMISFVLWPALWAQPIQVFDRIFKFTFERSDADVLSPMFFNGEIISSGAFELEYFYFYPLTYLWHSTPYVWGGLLFLMVLFVVRPKQIFEQIPWDIAVRFLLFAFMFTVIFTFSNQKFDRYLLPVYLVLDVLAALGWWYGARWLAFCLQINRNFLVSVLVLGVVVAANSFLLYQVFPYGISYFNPLMGGPEKAPEVLQIGEGEGLDLAAEYMLTVHDKRNLTIMSSYSGAFGFHFDRKVKSLPLYEYHGFESAFEADYVILYLNNVQRGMSGPIVDFLKDKPAEYTVVINGIEYAWIYHMSEFIDQ